LFSLVENLIPCVTGPINPYSDLFCAAKRPGRRQPIRALIGN
jgi:hypothetical protein